MDIRELIEVTCSFMAAFTFLRGCKLLRRTPPECDEPRCFRLMSLVSSRSTVDELMWRCPTHKHRKLSVRYVLVSLLGRAVWLRRKFQVFSVALTVFGVLFFCSFSLHSRCAIKRASGERRWTPAGILRYRARFPLAHLSMFCLSFVFNLKTVWNHTSGGGRDILKQTKPPNFNHS